jgi:hypothetical protein
MNLNYVFGTHSSFFYYGFDHLCINLINYIKKGLENKELVYAYIFPEMYKIIVKFLDNNNINSDNIKFKSLDELILLNSSKGFSEVDKIMSNIISEALSKGFSGVRLINQPSFAIKQTSKQDFLDFEKILTKLFDNKKGSVLCIYDIEDYSHSNNYIDISIIKSSFNTHSHIMSKFELMKI